MLWCCTCLHDDTSNELQQLVYDPTISAEGRPDDWDEVSYPRCVTNLAVTSMSDAEKMREKARLQDLVKSFAKRAVNGIKCELIYNDSGVAVPAKYFIDRRLQSLKIIPADSMNAEVEGDLECIREAYDFQAGSHLVPTAVKQGLRLEQKKRFVLISFVDKSSDICLLESSSTEREQCVMCMKILRLYSQTGGPA
mmetsp:Transcript_43365/g.68656  ORF Transcript_43365/g.68656 Transcript_43365/m.68656 type:complete len:195 (+) Transcript_43365:83-667(+)|eukprot:CAMPEP_0169114766 /NCGR_PEP_ID=MMETSP1015-20121227/28950_1 /TAXON_ID=342587 /ORGANISM="Karlodinium micrum, Strain CCMP2283" /LENGTH=194 /DNA_ID=CAMNT_0009177105 /DNA_START=70 /DNA_END=654 /DNA_ORIENTATION=-